MSLDYFLDISAPSDAVGNVVTCMELISVDISNCEISGSYSLPHHRFETGIFGVDVYINGTTLWRSTLGKILQTWTVTPRFKTPPLELVIGTLGVHTIVTCQMA